HPSYQRFKITFTRRYRLQIRIRSNEKVLLMNLRDHNSQTSASILKSVAAKALLTLLDGRESLFFDRIALTEGGFRKDSVSPHRTVVALLGLLHFAESGLPHSFDLEAIEEAIF